MYTFQRSFAAAVGAVILAAAWCVSSARADQPVYYSPPTFKVQVKPGYPESAKAKHETGTVSVKVLVAANGSVKQVLIAKSSGHKDLDDEVLKVAKESTYNPATRGGTPTTAYYDFSYNFTMAGLTETAEATGTSTRMLAEDPKNVPARLQLIDADINAKNYSSAESLANSGVQILPSDARLWAARGSAYYSDGSSASPPDPAKLKTAVDSYEQAQKLDPKTVPASTAASANAQYALSLWQSQQYEACIPYASKAIAQAPKQWEYHMLKGDCESGQANYKAAMTDYQSAQQLDDKKDPELSARLLASMGSAQLNMGDEAAGLNSINQAEQLYPKGVAAYQDLATYYITKGNLNAALNPLIKIAQLNPQNVQAQINIGDIYVRQNNFAEAQASFNKALQIDPKNGDAQFGLAEIAAKKGDIKTTDTELQKAIAMNPANAAFYNATIAQFLETQTADKVDHSADAQRYANAATQADPNLPVGWYALGIAYADQNKKDMANSALRKAFDLYKAKGDQNGMQQTNSAYTQINKGQTLMGTGGQGGGTGKNITTPGDMPH